MVVKILFLDEFFDERKKKVCFFFFLFFCPRRKEFSDQRSIFRSQLRSAAQTSDRHFEEKKLINQLLCLRII